MKGLQRAIESLIELGALALGRMRAKLLAFRGADIKETSFLGARFKAKKPWCMSIGKRFYAEDDVYVKIVGDNATVQFGEYVFIGKGTEFDIQSKLYIGDHTVIAPYCLITDHNHGLLGGLRIDEQPCEVMPVTIGSDVWLGTGVTVLPGVTIGEGAVVGANAVVTKDVPPMAVVAGVPAKLLRYRHNKLQC